MPKLDSNRDAGDQDVFKYALAAGLFLGTVAVAGHAMKGVLGGIGNKAGRAAIGVLGAITYTAALGRRHRALTSAH